MTPYVYVDPDPYRRAEIGDAYRAGGFTVVASMADLETFLGRNPTTLLIVIGAAVDLDEALTFTAYQRVQRPVIGVILLRRDLEPETVVRALSAGVREVCDESESEHIKAAAIRSADLSKALSMTMRLHDEPAQNAKIVTLFAGKGGCGKSVIATNLATTLAAGGSRRVLLVDLDLQFGDVAIMLRLVPTRSIADGIAMAGRLDEAGLRSLFTPYRPGVETLLAPASPAEAEHVPRELISEMLQTAMPLFDFIVVDTPSFVNEQVLAALDMTDWFVPVVTPDMPTLKSVRLTMEMFDLLEYPKERRITVFNRADSEVGLTIADVEEAVGARLAVHLPSSRDVPVSVNKGAPLALEFPAHPFSVAIRRLADRCAGIKKSHAKRRQFFSFGRKGTP